MFELIDNCPEQAVIKVIGVGGGGGNAVEYMIRSKKIEQVDFVNANTDALVLKQSAARILQLGSKTARGLGAGADPEIGKLSAEEDTNQIREVLTGADILFITAGMGGGTGTGAAPIIAQIAKDMGILTVAVVTKPFPFEGKKRMQIAEQGIDNLAKVVDSLITIPNARLLPVLGKGVTLLEAFKAVNDVLLSAVQGISELITRPGLINVDFADVRTVMSEMGLAMMGTGIGRGDNRARKAAELAISSPLLDNINLYGAKGVLVNITGGSSLSIAEFEEVGEVVKSLTADDATVIVGTVIDNQMDDELRVTLVATGLEPNYAHFGSASVSSNLGVGAYAGYSNLHRAPEEVNLKHREYQHGQLKEQNSNLHSSFSEQVGLKDYREYQHNQQREQLNQVAFGGNSYVENDNNLKDKVKKWDNSGFNSGINNNLEQNLDYLDIPAFLRRQSD